MTYFFGQNDLICLFSQKETAREAVTLRKTYIQKEEQNAINKLRHIEGNTNKQTAKDRITYTDREQNHIRTNRYMDRLTDSHENGKKDKQSLIL